MSRLVFSYLLLWLQWHCLFFEAALSSNSGCVHPACCLLVKRKLIGAPSDSIRLMSYGLSAKLHQIPHLLSGECHCMTDNNREAAIFTPGHATFTGLINLLRLLVGDK